MPPTPHHVVEELTRETVYNVFENMLDLKMRNDHPAPLALANEGQIISSVGFIGQANGTICLNASVSFARTIAGRMLGLTEAEVDSDDMINDAFGELGNVVVGTVKSRLCDCGWPCALTTPSIRRESQLDLKVITDAKRTLLGFRAGDQRLITEVLIKDHQP